MVRRAQLVTEFALAALVGVVGALSLTDEVVVARPREKPGFWKTRFSVNRKPK